MIALVENDAIRLFLYIHSMKHKILLFLFAALMMSQCVLILRADVHYIAVASDRHGPETDAERAASPTAQRSVVLGLTGIPDTVEFICLDGDIVGSQGGNQPRNKPPYYSSWIPFATSDDLVSTSPNEIDRTSPALALQNEGSDNVSVIEGHEGLIYDVTLNARTLYKDGHWNTLCLPFDVDLTDPTSPLFGATAKTLTGASFDVSTGVLALNFEKTTGTSSNHWEVKDYMYAGTPYLVKWDT